MAKRIDRAGPTGWNRWRAERENACTGNLIPSGLSRLQRERREKNYAKAYSAQFDTGNGMAHHPSRSGETIEEFRAGGAEAGEKAGKQMVAKCCPPGNTDSSKFVLDAIKASLEATDQMRKSGSTEENISAWLEAFDVAFKPHAQHVVNILRLA